MKGGFCRASKLIRLKCCWTCINTLCSPKDRHSVYAGPLIVDADNYDFHLRPESPALTLGFKAIDVSTVGPRERRAGARSQAGNGVKTPRRGI